MSSSMSEGTNAFSLWLQRWAKVQNRHLFLSDVFVFTLTPALALLLRIESVPAIQTYLRTLVLYTFLMLPVRLVCFFLCGLYRRYWRYASISELNGILQGVGISSLIGTVFFCLGWWTEKFFVAAPRSLPVLDGLLVLCCVAGTRFSVRIAGHLQEVPTEKQVSHVLIIGAGNVGQSIAKVMRSNAQLRLSPIGFLDDDPRLLHLHISNLPVLGTRANLPDIVRSHHVDQVIIAMPRASGKCIRETLTLCEQLNLTARIIPGFSTLLSEKVTVNQIRKVEIEDLLRREAIVTDISHIQQFLRGKRVMVTGGGGSIGSELCRQIIACQPASLAVLGHGENSIFEITNELLTLQKTDAHTASSDGNAEILSIIADIRDRKRIIKAVSAFQPDIIFHAAAHKHVPLMESNPSEALTNNIFGTKNVLDAAVAAEVPHFVLISTDKAVNPTSIMGTSKRVAELLVIQAASRTRRPYVVVRFGNVLGSRGSVVPTFKRQIAMGGPVTVSHPEMRRFFMTIPEAVQLLLQAAALGQGKEIFMLDMGEPVKIADLARDLIELSGLEVGRDIDIAYTGIRPGEKLYEELFLAGESYLPTPHEKIFSVCSAQKNDLNVIDVVLEEMQQAIASGERERIIHCLRTLVPEFLPDEWRQQNQSEANKSAEAIVRLSKSPRILSGASR